MKKNNSVRQFSPDSEMMNRAIFLEAVFLKKNWQRKIKFFGLLVMFLITPVVASSIEITKNVLWEKGTVSIKPCGLQFEISDRWDVAPKGVVTFPNQSGFMLGKRGLKDENGHNVIPTISVFWKKLTDSQKNKKIKGEDIDPLLAFAMDNRPDLHTEIYKLKRMFIWQDGSLTMKYAIGFEFSAVLRNRPSRTLAIYSIDRTKELGVQILVEIPEDVFGTIQEEVATILRSFSVVSPKIHGRKEAFYSKVNEVFMIEIRSKKEEG